MGKPHEQEDITDQEPDDDDSENLPPHDSSPDLGDDDDFIDDWIDHVDDFDSSDDVNNW